MIKTIQYLAEADPTRVLNALDLKSAFQNVSRRAMLHSVEQSVPLAEQSLPGLIELHFCVLLLPQ